MEDNNSFIPKHSGWRKRVRERSPFPENLSDGSESMKLFNLILSQVATNCYVFVDEKSGEGAVIDPGAFSPELKKLIETEMKQLKYILLTHGHFDHILGVHDLKEMTGAKVAIHELDAPCLGDEKRSLACEGYEKQKNTVADILLHDGDSLSVGETRFKVLHTPGHTIGSVCYIVDSENLIFSGDTLFCMTVGRTDFVGGNWESLLDSLKKLRELPDDYAVYTGHNVSTTIGREKTKNRYMRNL